MAISSSMITFIDTTDTKKIDIHIASNHPTVQIYDSNASQKPLTPDWEQSPLELTPIVYIDSVRVTNDAGYNFLWTKIKGSETTSEEEISPSKILRVPTNKDLDESSTVRYRCIVTYGGKSFSNEITFARIVTGKDGENGDNAPAVQAQYSKDGLTNWTSTLNASEHKYIHFSYDNGHTWTQPIKIAGEDGTSVQIKGAAYTNDALITGNVVDLYSDETIQTKISGIKTGDSYLVNGYLCVYNADNQQFICTGKIQGPSGPKGDSYYLFIRYADDTNGTNISATAGNRKYIGFYRSSVNVAPTDVSTTTWGWTKFVGDDAKSITLSANSQVFKVDKSNVVSPATLIVTAQATNTSITEWLYSINGGQTFSDALPTGVTRNGNQITITGKTITSNSITIRAKDNTHSDTLTVYKVFDGDKGDKGVDAPIAFLTNESIGFAANANGQITGTTVYCNVVAYNGTTKVTPTIGTISGLPTGMTIGTITTTSNELIIPIIIANNATLGSVTNNNGTIDIPVITPVVTNLKLSWSKVNSGAKGETGVGINSVTVKYSVSDSALSIPTEDKWQLNIPVVADGKYLWTHTIIDYTDPNKADTITHTYTKQGVKGETGSPGSSVTVSKIEYQSGTSATTTPTGTWSSNVVSVAEGNYLWTRTTFSDGKVAYGVAKQGINGGKGDKGDTGRGISKITEYYLATTESSGVTAATSGWTTTIQIIDVTKKYLWNYELITYTDNTTSTTTPVIIGVFGNTGVTGKGIKSVAEYYLATTSSSGVTTSTTGWTTTMQALTATNKYLWNYELITYTDDSTATINPVIIGVYGDKGANGTNASLVDITPSALYFKSTTGKDGTFTPDYIYLYPRFQTVTFSKWEYSVNGGTTWVAASGANGLTISTYNSVANTLRIAKTSTLYTDAVTSISFRCVSSNASVYDTVSIAKLFDVDVEEINTRITNSLAEVKTTTDSISSRVSATETSIGTINNNISSITNRVSAAEQKITPTAIVSTVRQSTDYTNDLGKKVNSTEIISKINQTAESVTISANKIGLLGATNIPDLTADKIKGGTLTLGGSSATTQNGQLLVKNASNVDMLKLNKDGIVVKSGHLAIASDFANQTYNWSTNTWTTTTNTSQLDIGDDYIRMGVYSPSGYTNYMRLLDSGLYFQGNATGIGSWGSFIGHDDYGDFVIQDTVRGYIVFKGQDNDTEIANLSSSVFNINVPVVLSSGIQGNMSFANNSGVRTTNTDGRDISLIRVNSQNTLVIGEASGGGVSRVSMDGVFNNTSTSAANMLVDSGNRLYRSTASSQRYKTDIQNIQLEDLKPEKLYDLPVREFKYKEGYLAEEDPRIDTFVPGFIAEEVAEVYPIACEYNGDDPENWNIRFIVPAMLKLIQDQKKEIEALKEQINNKVVN